MKTDLKRLRDFSLHRCIVPPTKIQIVQLPLFSDASEQAYSAVIYARMEDRNDFVTVNLMTGKKEWHLSKQYLFRVWICVVLIWESNFFPGLKKFSN